MEPNEASFPQHFNSSGANYERVVSQHALPGDDALRDGEPTPSTYPIYRKQDDGALVIFPGRVFVRLADGRKLDELVESFRSAGYTIDNAPAWAPHAGWLRAPGGPGAALAGLARLAALAGVESVEPELLRKRARR